MNGTNTGCSCKTDTSQTFEFFLPMAPSEPSATEEDIVCCGPPPGPPSGPFEKPGYKIESYVSEFLLTETGNVPAVRTELSKRDRFQTLLTRMNIGRNDYKIVPGLYCSGNPDKNSEILVTSNYKLTFDQLRSELSGINAWILVLDTRGINVWCAAGKGTFGTNELVNRINKSGITKLVSHKKIILPQLGATGVSARDVKEKTGFSVIWGPVSTKDIQPFIKNGLKADRKMRAVTFTLAERVALIPVEISLSVKPALYIMMAILIISGIGRDFFSFSRVISKGTPAIAVIITGIVSGTIITPLFLKKLPGAAFSVKGALAGFFLSLPVALWTSSKTGFSGIAALIIISTSISSYLAMNFTGSTPFTSPSGVEKEMRRAIPVQTAAVLAAAVLWIYSGLRL